MANRLGQASSPYLRQHAGNPVDWYEWGPEALDRAAREDKPIHLSIGYAACHWCHVMAHESFEDPATAALLNERFVNIKVDREERPDLDGIYMQAVQALTGQGGWPMTVFLLPDGSPFYAGTYFPPEDRHGLPAFRRVAAAVADAYRSRGDEVRRSADGVRRIYEPRPRGRPIAPGDGPRLEQAVAALERRFDPVHAGFGGAPKFPPSMVLSFLIAQWARTGSRRVLGLAHDTFLAMVRGGIYDQLAGGIHRYSVDDRWLVPHFEKMLYDNALFVRAGLELWQATGDAGVRTAVEDTLDWLRRELRAPEGGYYSSIDADSEGEEGRFYVWSADDVAAVAGADGPVAAARWGVTEAGNFEGVNVLHAARDWDATAEQAGVDVEEARRAVERARVALLAARNRRPRPARDDKVVASWNGLMLRSLALAARVLGSSAYEAQARATGEFLLATLVREGRVRRAWRAGRLREQGFLEDQAAVGLGLLELHGLTGERRWLDAARMLSETILARFWDRDANRLFDTADDHERLVARPCDPTDNATPSGTSLAAELLLQMGHLTGREDLDAVGRAALEDIAGPAVRFPAAFGHALVGLDLMVHGSIDVVLCIPDGASDQGRALLAALAAEYVPGLTLVRGPAAALAELPPAAAKPPVGGEPTAYVCRRYVCQPPVTVGRDLRATVRSVRAAAA